MFKFATACVCFAVATARLAADGPIVRVSQENHVVAACAAFASDGGSAAATVKASGVSVDITDPCGHVSNLALPFDQTRIDPRPTRFPGETTCRAYFDRESDLIAIGMEDGWFSAWVGVVDSKHATWLGHWTIGPTGGILHPRLAGFFGKNVIVIGQPFTRTARRVQAREGSALSLVFDPQGQQFQGGPVERTYASGHTYPIYADAGNNRLWFFPCATVPGRFSSQPDCPVDWLALTGDTSSTEFNPLS